MVDVDSGGVDNTTTFGQKMLSVVSTIAGVVASALQRVDSSMRKIAKQLNPDIDFGQKRFDKTQRSGPLKLHIR